MDAFQGMSSYDVNRFLLWVARATISKIKNNERKPSIDLAKNIAKELEMTVDKLIE